MTNRRQKIIRLPQSEVHEMIVNFLWQHEAFPALDINAAGESYDDIRIVSLITNPFLDCVDVIIAHDLFDELPELSTPEVAILHHEDEHTVAGPKDWAMEDSTKE